MYISRRKTNKEEKGKKDLSMVSYYELHAYEDKRRFTRTLHTRGSFAKVGLTRVIPID
jgi:hypothetical protein